MIEGEEDANDSYPDDWISYDEYVEEHIMLEDSHLVTGPGPPKFDEAPPPPEFLLPPPPLPGHSNECSTFSSHFDSCDISKESTSVGDPHLHLMSVIVAVLCLVILASCITIFLIWRRRRSKAHQAALHSYCVSSSSSGLASQFYDDLYISNHSRVPVAQNQYCVGQFRSSTGPSQMGGRPSQMGTHPSLDLSSFLLRTSPTGQPIYEEIPNSLGPLLPSSDSCSDYVDTTSGYHSLESETGPFLLPLTRAPVVSRDIKSNKQFFTFHRPQGQSHQDWGGRGGGTTSPRARVTSPSPRTRGSGGSTSPRNRGSRQLMASHSRTMEPKKVAASKSFCGSSGAEREREGRRRQEDFLPRHAWTEEEEWARPDTSDLDWDRAEPPDLVKGNGTTTTSSRMSTALSNGNTTSTSDITVSPSSSESYPECRF